MLQMVLSQVSKSCKKNQNTKKKQQELEILKNDLQNILILKA